MSVSVAAALKNGDINFICYTDMRWFIDKINMPIIINSKIN